MQRRHKKTVETRAFIPAAQDSYIEHTRVPSMSAKSIHSLGTCSGQSSPEP